MGKHAEGGNARQRRVEGRPERGSLADRGFSRSGGNGGAIGQVFAAISPPWGRRTYQSSMLPSERSAERTCRSSPVTAPSAGVDALAMGEQSQNPLDAIVRSSAPRTLSVPRRHDGGALDVLGWNIIDAKGSRSTPCAPDEWRACASQ